MFNKTDRVNRIASTVFKMRKSAVDWYYSSAECAALINKVYPAMDAAFIAMLSALDLNYQLNVKIGEFTYDVFIPDQKVLINFAHSLTHSCGIDVVKLLAGECSTGMSRFYHRECALNAEHNGYECVHVFDWDDALKLALMFVNKQTISADDCRCDFVAEEEMFLFLDMYHPRCHSDSSFGSGYAHLGLYYGDELVALLTVGLPKYNKSYDAEIYRLCGSPEYTVIGGWRRLFNTYLNMHNPDSVLAFRDMSKAYWGPYVEMGMAVKEYADPRKYWSRSSERLTDGIRHLNSIGEGGRGRSWQACAENLNMMLEHGWLPVYDCSSAIYEWRSTQ